MPQSPWFFYEFASKNLNNVFLSLSLHPKTAADWFVSCQLKDAEFVKCSTKSVQLIFDKIIDSSLKIDNMSSIDPFYVEKLSVVQSNHDSPVNLDATLTKVKVLGFNKMKIVESQVSKKDYSWLTKVHIPKMRLEGMYNMNGRILLIPLNVSIWYLHICYLFAQFTHWSDHIAWKEN